MLMEKQKKKYTVKVVYGEKSLVECMKNIIKDHRKYLERPLYNAKINAELYKGYFTV